MCERESSICRQISPGFLPRRAISIRASFYLGLPGTADATKLASR